MKSLSVESKLLYGILTSETDEIYEAKWASYRARASAAAAMARSTTRSTAPLRAPSDSAAAASASSATSSTTTGPTTPAASNLVLSFERETTDEFTPEARPLYDLLVSGSASPTPSASSRAPSKAISTSGTLESAAATAIPEKDIRSVTPTNCSMICPGGDTSAASTPSSQVASSAFTPASPTSVSAALVSPAVGVLLESDDHITLAPPAICLILRPSPSATIDTVVFEVCSISLVLASGASTLPATFLVDNVDTAKHTENRLQPWPPPRYATSQEENICKDMPQVLLWHWFVLESTQLMLWAAKNPWPPPFPNISTVFCFASCGILNLHSTLDNLQLSRDCQVLKTMTIGYSVVILVSNSIPGVPSIQLQPTLFKWPVSFCYDTHLHIASTSVESLRDLLFTRRAMSIFCTWCYMHDLHWPPGGTTMAIPDWGMLISSMETWVHMTGDFASVYFQWAITVQQSTSSGAYLVILNERAELQQRYTCERVLLLPLVFCKGWMSQLILQGQPHYFELMQWSFSHAQQQSAFCFFTPGHLLFPCCAVVQWKIPWIIILVSLRSWFQCFRAQAESLCSWENFQWTIAWSLRYHLSLSIPLLFSCPLLVKLVELKTVVFSNVCLNLTTGTVVFECSSSTLTTAGMRSVCVQLEQLKMVQCLHYKEPPELNICASATQAMSWTEIQPTRQVWTVLLSYQNGDSVEHSFDQVMEKLTCPTITCKLHYSSLVIEELLAAPYSSWCIRCVNHDIEETQECVLFLQPKPPWSLLEPNISIDGFMSNLIIASECMHVTIIYLALNQFGIESATKWLQMQLVGGYWTFKIAFWFSWDISCTIDSETSTKHISCTFSHAVQNLEPPDYFSVAMLVLSNSLSQAWVLYLSVACILRWGSELMTWEIASSEDDILAYTERVLTPWDPGGSDLVPVATWNITQLQFFHLTWDPGGCIQHRLEVKPILKEWGLSTTYLYSRLVWIVGRFFWARPAQELNKVGTRSINTRKTPRRKVGLERTDWRRLRPRRLARWALGAEDVFSSLPPPRASVHSRLQFPRRDGGGGAGGGRQARGGGGRQAGGRQPPPAPGGPSSRSYGGGSTGGGRQRASEVVDPGNPAGAQCMHEGGLQLLGELEGHLREETEARLTAAEEAPSALSAEAVGEAACRSRESRDGASLACLLAQPANGTAELALVLAPQESSQRPCQPKGCSLPPLVDLLSGSPVVSEGTCLPLTSSAAEMGLLGLIAEVQAMDAERQLCAAIPADGDGLGMVGPASAELGQVGPIPSAVGKEPERRNNSVPSLSSFLGRAAQPTPPPLLATPAGATAKPPQAAISPAAERRIRSSGRLAAKPTSSLSALDKAKLVLLKKSGVVAEDATPTVSDLQKYRNMYTGVLPPYFMSAVTALVDAVSPSKKKDAVPTTSMVVAA